METPTFPMFSHLDRDGDGTVTALELEELLRELGVEKAGAEGNTGGALLRDFGFHAGYMSSDEVNVMLERVRGLNEFE